MQFTTDEKSLAIVTGMRALVIALVESDALDLEIFERHITLGIARMDAVGETGAAAAMAEVFEPMVSDIRRFIIQRRGT